MTFFNALAWLFGTVWIASMGITWYLNKHSLFTTYSQNGFMHVAGSVSILWLLFGG